MKRKMAFSLFVVAGGLLTIMVTQRGFAAPPAKVLICHVDPDCDGIGPEVIEVSERSLDAHLAHGDCLAPEEAVPGDACPGLEECNYPDCEDPLLLGDEEEEEEEEEDEEVCGPEDEDAEDCPKVTICHFSPGNGEARTIEICEDCVPDHLGHGDVLGSCEEVLLLGDDEEEEEEEEEDEEVCGPDDEDAEDCPKVTICHFPPGTGEPRTIEICEDCVPDHLGHGDLLGSCEQTANAKVINGLAGGDAGFDAPGSACGALGMLSLSLGLVGIGGLRVRRKRFCK